MTGPARPQGNDPVATREVDGLERGLSSSTAAVPGAGDLSDEVARIAKGRSLVSVVGTAEVTTLVSALCVWLLETAGLEPAFALGKAPPTSPDLLRMLHAPPSASLDLTARTRAGSPRRRLVGAGAKPPPAVVDEAFGHDVCGQELGAPHVVIVVAREASARGEASARAIALAERVPEDGLVVCDARDVRTYDAIERRSRAATTTYAIDADTDARERGEASAPPIWLGVLAPPEPESGARPFDLFVGGSSCGRFALPGPAVPRGAGPDAIRAAVAAVGACAQAFGVDMDKARRALSTFAGLR